MNTFFRFFALVFLLACNGESGEVSQNNTKSYQFENYIKNASILIIEARIQPKLVRGEFEKKQDFWKREKEALLKKISLIQASYSDTSNFVCTPTRLLYNPDTEKMDIVLDWNKPQIDYLIRDKEYYNTHINDKNFKASVERWFWFFDNPDYQKLFNNSSDFEMNFDWDGFYFGQSKVIPSLAKEIKKSLTNKNLQLEIICWVNFSDKLTAKLMTVKLKLWDKVTGKIYFDK